MCGLDLAWMQGDYRVGDVITFHSQTVHKALPNQTSSVRLSADFRYQLAESVISPESLEPHGAVLSWDEIYQGWENAALQYYWRPEELECVPFDPIVKWQKEHIC